MTADAPVSPDPKRDAAAFHGGADWPSISQLADGDEVVGCYLSRDVKKLETKAGKPYLRLLLADRTGTIDAYVWDEIDRWEAACRAKGVLGVKGRVSRFQDRLQLKVSSVEALRATPSDLERLLPVSPRDRRAMGIELDRMIVSVHDASYRKLLHRCLGAETEPGRAFRTHPAAQRNHHAYLAGLLEHTLSVAHVSRQLATHYRDQGLDVDEDLLTTGALLHDIGKTRELEAFPASGYTDEGQLLGHIVIGIEMVADAAAAIPDFPRPKLLLVQHLIASHQGRPEWDSPRLPQLVEALILHYADDLDAKLNHVRRLLDGVPDGSWSAYDRGFGRSFLQTPARPLPSGPRASSPDGEEDAAIDLFRD